MKNIYKREPLVRSLPTGYAEMDAVNYKNLSGFKGLQIYDNPLIADPNSTYSCKNVYVDEHGNLTVRPALMAVEKLRTTVLWCHEYSDGTTLRTEYTDGSYKLVVTNGDVSNSINFAEEPTVIPVESGGLYLFVKTEHNILYKIENTEFVIVEGTKFLDDPLKPDISHYNILNNKVIQEYAQAITGTDRPESLYGISLQTPVTVPASHPINIYYKDGICVICSKDAIMIITKTNVVNLNVDTGYQRRSSDWAVEVTDNVAKITVVCYSELDETAEFPALVGMQSVKYFEIDITTGERVHEYTVSCTYSSTRLFAGYGHVLALVQSSVNVYYAYIKQITEDIKITNASGMTNWTQLDDTFYLKTGTAVNVWGYCTKQYVILAVRNSITDTPKIALDFYDWTGKAVSKSKSLTIYWSEGDDEDEYDNYQISDAIFHTYYDGRDYCIFKPGSDRFSFMEDLAVVFSLSSTDVVRYKFGLNPPWDKVRNISSDGVYVGDISNTLSLYKFDDTVVEYSGDSDVYMATDDFILKSNMAIWRIPALASREIDRPTNVIPVLSDISEQPVTGFFLDNCHWFVTEHSVFGTGFDGNGLYTIENFDPLKFFKFSEKITGAIRLSDTSFWVFHNNGAYLIYKTALTLANQTEYRWLCTATAKSKGCDFTNALVTLPVTSYVATVTNSDICTVQMRENIQSDERSLVPITMSFAADIRQLLSETESVKIVNYKYLTIFILNRVTQSDTTPAVVLDNATNSWWLWEFPVRYVSQAWQSDTDTCMLCPYEGIIVSLNTDEYVYSVGSIEYSVYADRLDVDQSPTQIDWGWQSAMQVFNTVERRKQLLFTTFVFDDFMPDDDTGQTIEFGYYFNIYSSGYVTSTPDATTATVFRVSNKANKTTISSFNYLQLVLCSMNFNAENMNFEVLTRSKICCISLKYRLLRGEWT